MASAEYPACLTGIGVELFLQARFQLADGIMRFNQPIQHGQIVRMIGCRRHLAATGIVEITAFLAHLGREDVDPPPDRMQFAPDSVDAGRQVSAFAGREGDTGMIQASLEHGPHTVRIPGRRIHAIDQRVVFRKNLAVDIVMTAQSIIAGILCRASEQAEPQSQSNKRHFPLPIPCR